MKTQDKFYLALLVYILVVVSIIYATTPRI